MSKRISVYLSDRLFININLRAQFCWKFDCFPLFLLFPFSILHSIWLHFPCRLANSYRSVAEIHEIYIIPYSNSYMFELFWGSTLKNVFFSIAFVELEVMEQRSHVLCVFACEWICVSALLWGGDGAEHIYWVKAFQLFKEIALAAETTACIWAKSTTGELGLELIYIERRWCWRREG